MNEDDWLYEISAKRKLIDLNFKEIWRKPAHIRTAGKRAAKRSRKNTEARALHPTKSSITQSPRNPKNRKSIPIRKTPLAAIPSPFDTRAKSPSPNGSIARNPNPDRRSHPDPTLDCLRHRRLQKRRRNLRRKSELRSRGATNLWRRESCLRKSWSRSAKNCSASFRETINLHFVYLITPRDILRRNNNKLSQPQDN